MNMRHTQSAGRGFSLVELLVAISIIGILISVVYVSFNAAREQARDDARKTDLKQLQLAVELYRAQNGRYPAACNTSWSGQVGSTFACSSGGEYIVGLTPDFIASLPIDPNIGGSRSYLYRVDSTGSNYKIMAHDTVESKTVTSYNDEFARCPRSFNSSHCGNAGPQSTTYAVYSAGAESW